MMILGVVYKLKSSEASKRLKQVLSSASPQTRYISMTRTSFPLFTPAASPKSTKTHLLWLGSASQVPRYQPWTMTNTAYDAGI